MDESLKSLLRPPVSGLADITVVLDRLEQVQHEFDKYDWAAVSPWIRKAIQAVIDDPAWSSPASARIVSEPALDSLLGRLLALWSRTGRLVDNDTLETLLGAALAGCLTVNGLQVALGLCEEANSWDPVPAKKWKWNRIKIELLDILFQERGYDYNILFEQLSAMDRCADSINSEVAAAPVMTIWVARRSHEIITRIAEAAHRHPPVPDDWVGVALMICDNLCAAGYLPETADLLRATLRTAAACGPSSSRALRPGEPSRFREDAAYLLDLLQSAQPERTRER